MRRYTATTEASKQTVMRMPPGFARVPAFNIFFKENFVKKEGMSITTVMKDLREKWRQMSEEERKPPFPETVGIVTHVQSFISLLVVYFLKSK
ncbi:hypothetical protein AB6A40_000871 [Gnathostoma spinigerum]|uniref:HMG box domain-containing protein n=1 Tax=Gnathostoma spinigerum TaxID=75299 RepID=A0ABD6EBU9_9BILA